MGLSQAKEIVSIACHNTTNMTDRQTDHRAATLIAI